MLFSMPCGLSKTGVSSKVLGRARLQAEGDHPVRYYPLGADLRAVERGFSLSGLA